MGLGDLMKNPIRRAFLKLFLEDISILSISKGEMEYVLKTIGSDMKIEYLPFGVDINFWCQSDNKTSEYVLTIGNDSNRDYKLLLSVWKKEYPELKIITRHNISSELSNVKIIKGDWNEQLMSDEKIREYIQNANFIIVPVQQTSQPSGQSFCLQAMACGKAVIMSNIIGLWEPELMVNKENCMLYQPDNKQSILNNIEILLTDLELKNKLGKNARVTVETNFCSSNTGVSIQGYLDR